MKSNQMALAYILITILLWGLWGYFGKLAMIKGMKPLAVFLAEIIFGLMLGIILMVLYSNVSVDARIFKEWNIYGVLSGFSLALGLMSYYMALNLNDVHIVVPLTAIYPIVAVILSFFLLGEIIKLQQFIGVLLVVAGTLLLIK